MSTVYNKKLIILLCVGLSVILIPFFLSLNGKEKSKQHLSNVAIIFAYINRAPAYTIEPNDSVFNLIDTEFRTLKSSPKRSASEERLANICEVLLKKMGSDAISALNLRNLVVPNSSQEIKLLRKQAAQAWGKKDNLNLITFSAPCMAKDGKAYYYVEQVSKTSKRGWADVYIIYKGKVESVISIWTN